MADTYNEDKEKCIEDCIHLKSYQRNMISNVICAGVGVGCTILTILKISSPWVLFASSCLYTLGHFIKQDAKSSTYKEQITLQDQELKLRDREIRRLESLTTNSGGSGGNERNTKDLDQFDVVD